MDPEVIGNWKRAGKEHPVALTELYAVCVARETWKDTLDDNRCIFFIDNQGDLDALIKGYSSEASMQSLLLVLERLDAKNPCMPWYCRVPSQSNIADLRVGGGKIFWQCYPIAKLSILFVLSNPRNSV